MESRTQLSRKASHMLRGRDHQNGVHRGQRTEIIGGPQTLVERHAGQKRPVDVPLVDVLHRLRFPRP